MPVVLRWKGWRFFFYTADRDEPPHIHVYKAGKEMKFWLDPVKLAYGSKKVMPSDVRMLEKIVSDHQTELLEAWNEYFRD